MFCKFSSESRDEILKDKTYWLEFTNDLDGKGGIYVWIPGTGLMGGAIWRNHYSSFEVFLMEWEIV